MAGCRKAAPSGYTVPMGELVSVGPITYTVFEEEWKTELESGGGPRSPRNRFLVLRLTVTNGGGSDFNMPLLKLEDGKGKIYLEEQSGEGVGEWLGLIRVVKRNETANGRILFDVPPGSYKLHVFDNGDLENQQVKYVEIPFSMEPKVNVNPPSH